MTPLFVLWPPPCPSQGGVIQASRESNLRVFVVVIVNYLRYRYCYPPIRVIPSEERELAECPDKFCTVLLLMESEGGLTM